MTDGLYAAIDLQGRWHFEVFKGMSEHAEGACAYKWDKKVFSLKSDTPLNQYCHCLADNNAHHAWYLIVDVQQLSLSIVRVTIDVSYSRHECMGDLHPEPWLVCPGHVVVGNAASDALPVSWAQAACPSYGTIACWVATVSPACDICTLALGATVVAWSRYQGGFWRDVCWWNQL